MFSESTKLKVQRFGRFLSNMVMPNIGAFIAWGLITALFIPTGWLPNESLGKLVGPMITYLLPLLIGYTGGKIDGYSDVPRRDDCRPARRLGNQVV